MTVPYRVVWHSLDPRSPIAPVGPGGKSDFINIQRRLPRDPSHPPRLSHIVYFHYHTWDAELDCIYNEARDRIEEVHIKRMNHTLRACVATPAELECTLYERLSPSSSRDVSYFNMLMERGPLDVRMRPEKDDEGNRFIEVAVLCRSTGSGPWVIRFAGKLWNVNMTEEEELLTNSERRRLAINDSDWTLWGGQDPDEDMDDAGANQN